MNRVFEAEDWQQYRMKTTEPHARLEPLLKEAAVVKRCLEAVRDAGMIDTVDYDDLRFRAFRAAVAARFDIPWTAITPRMQRLIWAVNAIHRPKRMVAAGVFCGNTFISNAGAAIGPGAAYEAEDLVGIEIKAEEAERAARNVETLDKSGVARIVAGDAVEFCENYDGEIDLLYLDADGAGGKGKGIYLEILEVSFEKMPKGALVLAHNSINCAERLSNYLVFVRSDAMSASINCMVDSEGLEISMK